MEFETRAIHAGQEPDALTGSVNVPIYQTSTYAQDGVLQMRGGHDYARTINPTRTALEACLASLEGGRHGVCFSSGMGATTAVMELFAPGTRTVAINDVYGGTFRWFDKVARPRGVEARFVDLADDPASVLAANLTDRTRLVWFETPTNPLLRVADIAAVVAAEGISMSRVLFTTNKNIATFVATLEITGTATSNHWKNGTPALAGPRNADVTNGRFRVEARR